MLRQKHTSNIITRISMLATVLVCAVAAYALPPQTYTDESVLNQGRWVKIGVDRSGMYKITRAQLNAWGFTDMSRVHIYGYGGRRIADKLTAANYIDDLPMVHAEEVADGLVFYAVGPEVWESSTMGTYHASYNIYANEGCYFVSDREIDPSLMAKALPETGRGGALKPETSFTDYVHHEVNLTSPGEAGYVLVGENLKAQNNRVIPFDLPGYRAGENIMMELALVSKNHTPVNLTYSVNGKKLPLESSDKVAGISNTVYLHAGYTVTTRTFTSETPQVQLTVGLDNMSAVINAWINYITLNYSRDIALDSDGLLDFSVNASAVRLATSGRSGTRVWDVTDPAAISAVKADEASDALVWTATSIGRRTYTAWTPASQMPSPKYMGTVRNQNIHGMETPHMVIFTLPEFRAQALRLAQIHAEADEPLKVEVLNVDDVYNEFASGCADVSALRKCLKMFYDRPQQAAEGAEPVKLRYALLMGRATVDNRHLTSQFQGSAAYGTIPCWMGFSAKMQFSDNDAFGTDDYIAMLDDDTGTNLGIDNLSIAVGRMPVTSVSEAKTTIDKLSKYLNESKHGTWKNSFVFLADDGDNGIHLKQTEQMVNELETTPDNQCFVSKVYVDAYDIIGGACEGGRRDMFRMLDEGVVWWNFCGHANNHSWTAERMLTYTDINNLYLKNVPVLLAATCDFLRWDSNTISGGELLFHEPNGGTIATISATRPVYISDNGMFTRAMGRSISLRDTNGKLPRLGDIYRHAKNNILTENGEHRSNLNRLRFVLMGDPAMPLAMPHNIVRIERVGDAEVTPDAQVTLKALQQTTMSGVVCRPDGAPIDDFNGVVMVNIYDAEKSVTTKGVRENNVQITFEQHGDKLFAGSAQVKDGRFELRVAMPGEVADNFRPATVNMYAYSTENSTQAVGVNRDLYVYGLDENAAPDTNAPKIDMLALNDEQFGNGDDVNLSPLVMARISDDVSINISAAGIGHQMTLTLDGKRTYTDVSLFYTPSTDGSPSGVIAYPLDDLTPGRHTLTLRVWDTSANSTSQTIEFNAVENLTPEIYKIYTDVNPASTEVKFYIEHNRPEAELTASITVYDMLGRRLWETSAKLPSDMHTSYPITWDLCDLSGHRLPRGIYLYRATLSENGGETYSTSTRRLAITAQ